MDAKVENLLKRSANVVGTTIAEASVGFFLSGPSGALIGASTGAIKSLIRNSSENLLVDVANRIVSSREELRVGAAAAYSISKIKDNLEKGLQPRLELLNEDITGRNAANELFEGILLKCKDSHEEKKIKYISNIYANSIFEDISLGEANYRISLSEKMTYRQFCILALVEKHFSDLRDSEYIKGEKSFELRSILSEIYDLYSQGLIESYNFADKRAYRLSGILSIRPSSLRLTKQGKRQYNLMQLEDLEYCEYNALLEILN